jgi:Protein of unknown function (DUF2891)
MTTGAGALAELAGRMASTAVANATRELPYAPASVVRGPEDLVLPRVTFPAFYGCFDWHSAVHTHWLMVRLLRRHPGHLDTAAVSEVLDAHLTEDALRTETAHLRAWPAFERPYGWAWLVALAAECRSWADDAAGAAPAAAAEPGVQRWSRALEPAAAAVADLVLDWLPRAAHPVRDGTHANSAFALGLLLDAAGPLGLDALAGAVREHAGRWFLGDRDVPAAWEPSGQDFLSPTLCEADLVRRLLPADAFSPWLEGFWPALAAGGPAVLLEPVASPDRSDGQLGHLDGLNLSRAAGMRSVAAALEAGDPRRAVLLASADRHLTAGLPALAVEEYLSSHWLGTFAVLALEAGPGTAR